MAIDDRIKRAVDNAEALHYINHASHGFVLLRELRGNIDFLMKYGDDDPAIFAYQVNELMPAMASQLVKCKQWCNAVIQAGPDDIPDKGAKLCS